LNLRSSIANNKKTRQLVSWTKNLMRQRRTMMQKRRRITFSHQTSETVARLPNISGISRYLRSRAIFLSPTESKVAISTSRLVTLTSRFPIRVSQIRNQLFRVNGTRKLPLVRQSGPSRKKAQALSYVSLLKSMRNRTGGSVCSKVTSK